MGKSKKVKRLLFFFLAFVLILLSSFIFLSPQLTKQNITERFQALGLEIQAKSWKSSFFSKTIVLQDLLVTRPDRVEYPVLRAKKLVFGREYKSLILIEPEIPVVEIKPALALWKNITASFVSGKTEFEIRAGKIVFWKEHIFSGIPFQLQNIGLSGSLNNMEVSLKIPEGLSSLITFAPTARFFPNEDYFLKTKIENLSSDSGTLSELSLKSKMENVFSCKKLTWKNRAGIEMNVLQSDLYVERSHAGRWRIQQFAFQTLTRLAKELFPEQSLPPLKITLKDGAFNFADKYVFPLFEHHFAQSRIEIKRPKDLFSWNFQGPFPATNGTFKLSGNENNPFDSAEFKNIPLKTFYSYIHLKFPYEKLGGALSGRLQNRTVQLQVRDFSGTGLKSPDPFQEQTGLPTPLLLSLLNRGENQLSLEFTFARNWEDSLAHYCVETLQTRLSHIAELIIQSQKIEKLTWKPFEFSSGSLSFKEDFSKKLQVISDSLSFSENIQLVLQADQPLPYTEPTSVEWNIQTDSHGYRFIANLPPRKKPAERVLFKDLPQKRVKLIVQKLRENSKITPGQIIELPPSDKKSDTVHFELKIN